jgi:hypothetical protein
MVPEQLARPADRNHGGLCRQPREPFGDTRVVEQRQHAVLRATSDRGQVAQQLVYVKIHTATESGQGTGGKADP